MGKTDNYTIEELIELGDFSCLNESQKRIVLSQMSPEEFDKIRAITLINSPIIGIDKFGIQPQQKINNALLVKLNSSKKPVLINWSIYISSAAAILALLFLVYSQFFNSTPKTEHQLIVENEAQETKEELVEKLKEDSIENDQIERNSKIEKEEILVEVDKPIKNIEPPAINQYTKTENNLAINPDELKQIISDAEIAISATDYDATLGSNCNVEDQVFHYYTQIE
ncbi:hypothetical protein [Brumimicrobium mesophilum]|uniref:hypothetical protein n=1 Tax=Brumimicrobium mesophilum TaxID=392717 RepID=UPI000D13FE48|nr:hypothetical protein [Brumimicrobium mesophilum]